jgi:hypothetical protein
MNIIRESSGHFEARPKTDRSYTIFNLKQKREVCTAVQGTGRYLATYFERHPLLTSFELMALGSLIGLLNDELKRPG